MSEDEDDEKMKKTKSITIKPTNTKKIMVKSFKKDQDNNELKKIKVIFNLNFFVF